MMRKLIHEIIFRLLNWSNRGSRILDYFTRVCPKTGARKFIAMPRDLDFVPAPGSGWESYSPFMMTDNKSEATAFNTREEAEAELKRLGLDPAQYEITQDDEK
jgi:hypothetical protein